jgi:hypothetical protein
MGASRCVVCGELRARRGNIECSVCFLVRCLAEEHDAGEHDVGVNASCIACTRSPEYVAEIRAHHDAMRRQDDVQTALRERRQHLYGGGNTITPSRPLKEAAAAVRARHATGQIDHSQCDHERTAKARATCRRVKRTV